MRRFVSLNYNILYIIYVLVLKRLRYWVILLIEGRFNILFGVKYMLIFIRLFFKCNNWGIRNILIILVV